MPGQVVAVASGKGGVGKTTTVVNLGVVLRRADHSVALVDADLGMANLGPKLGVTDGGTLHDVLAGKTTLKDAVVEEAPGFAVLRGSESLMDYPDADPQNLREVLERLADDYEFVLVDTGAGMSHEDVLPLGLADRVVLVSSPDPDAIGDTQKTADLANLAGGDAAGLVVTKAAADTDAAAVAEEIGVELLGVIPFDEVVRTSTAAGQPLEVVDPDGPAAEAYRELADALADGNGDSTGAAPSAAGSETGEPATSEESSEPEPETGDETPSPAETDAESTESAEPETSEEPGEPSASAESEAADTDAEDEPADPPESDDESADDAEAATADQSDEDLDPPEGDDESAGDDEAGTADQPDEDPDPAEDEEEPDGSGGFLARVGRLFR